MTPRSLVLSAGFALALALPLAAQKSDNPKDPIKKPTVELSGSLDNFGLATQAPPGGVIVTAREWQRLSEAWVIKNPPKVDFDKEFLVVATTQAGKLVLNTKLNENGDLLAKALDNGDIQSGFRYAVLSVKRDGVKTVNGKPLPVE
jgi:hypothetical protein